MVTTYIVVIIYIYIYNNIFNKGQAKSPASHCFQAQLTQRYLLPKHLLHQGKQKCLCCQPDKSVKQLHPSVCLSLSPVSVCLVPSVLFSLCSYNPLLHCLALRAAFQIPHVAHPPVSMLLCRQLLASQQPLAPSQQPGRHLSCWAGPCRVRTQGSPKGSCGPNTDEQGVSLPTHADEHTDEGAVVACPRSSPKTHTWAKSSARTQPHSPAVLEQPPVPSSLAELAQDSEQRATGPCLSHLSGM